MRRVVCALLAIGLGCAPSAPRLGPRERAWLAASEEIPGSFLWRQRVRLARGARTQAFDVALQKRCGELTLVLLVPLAPAPLVLVQRGRELSVSGPAAARGAAPAERLLLDLHRAFFLALAPPAASSGVHDFVAGGQHFTDEWQSGRLARRSIRTEHPAATVVITYAGGWDPREWPQRASIDDRRFRYRLAIETISRETLGEDCAPAS